MSNLNPCPLCGYIGNEHAPGFASCPNPSCEMHDASLSVAAWQALPRSNGECDIHPEAVCGECAECDKHKELIACFSCYSKAARNAGSTATECPDCKMLREGIESLTLDKTEAITGALNATTKALVLCSERDALKIEVERLAKELKEANKQADECMVQADGALHKASQAKEQQRIAMQLRDDMRAQRDEDHLVVKGFMDKNGELLKEVARLKGEEEDTDTRTCFLCSAPTKDTCGCFGAPICDDCNAATKAVRRHANSPEHAEVEALMDKLKERADQWTVQNRQKEKDLEDQAHKDGMQHLRDMLG